MGIRVGVRALLRFACQVSAGEGGDILSWLHWGALLLPLLVRVSWKGEDPFLAIHISASYEFSFQSVELTVYAV